MKLGLPRHEYTDQELVMLDTDEMMLHLELVYYTESNLLVPFKDFAISYLNDRLGTGTLTKSITKRINL